MNTNLKSWEEAFEDVWNNSTVLKTGVKAFIRETLLSQKAEQYELGYQEGRNSTAADISFLLDEDEQAAVARIRKEVKAEIVKGLEGMKKITNKDCLRYEPDLCNLCSQREETEGYNAAIDAAIALLDEGV